MHNLQNRRKGIRQSSYSESSRRHLATTGELDQILNKSHSYNLSQVIHHTYGVNDTNTFSIDFWVRDPRCHMDSSYQIYLIPYSSQT